jgi:hypothetical protein
MKKTIFLLLFFVTSIFADKINWHTYQEGLSLKSSKPMFVFYSRDGCSYCKSAFDEMSINGTFIRYVNQNFNPVYLNLSKEEAPSFLESPVTPAFFLLKPNGTIIPDFKDGLYGYQGIVEELKFLNKGLFIYERMKK